MTVCILFLLSPALFSQNPPEELIPLRVLLHAHSLVSGEPTTVVELALLAKQKALDAVILTDYLKQKVSWHLFSWERPSIARFGFDRYFSEIEDSNRKTSNMLTLAGAEVMPFYWWSGSLWKGNWTVHDTQKNLLVFGLDAAALKEIPTLETGQSKFNAYHGFMQGKPYQAVIDYVAERGGLSVWSTPDEAFGADFKAGPVHFRTLPYTDTLLYTQGYTGIALYPEGMLKTGAPGGVWDQILQAYCRGRRGQAAWAFAEGVIHEEEARRKIDRWDNVVMSTGKSENEILDAMQKGRFYIRNLKFGQIWLQEFSLYDKNDPGKKYRMGEEFLTQGSVTVKIAASLGSNDLQKKLRVTLIRSGKEIHQAEHESGEINLEWTDSEILASGEKIYYRVTAETRPENVGAFVSNPIFVRRKP